MMAPTIDTTLTPRAAPSWMVAASVAGGGGGD